MPSFFDFILLQRFKKWFNPADEQTAYQQNRGCADHVFFLRCLTQHAKRYKKKLFLIAIDFDGAFDKVSRSHLIRKLCLFGAGTVFTACLASISMCTDNVIFRGLSHASYKLYSGIKQGSPLSPFLFFFYIDDVFNFLGKIYDGGRNVLDKLHVPIHADDATVIARDREGAICKLESMIDYCNQNFILSQYTKCEFLAVNGNNVDCSPLPFGGKILNNVVHIFLLGSHITSNASVKDEMKLHMKLRHKSVIKFYNFIRSNKLSPLSVKLKVLKSCVISSILYNCETFGDYVPKDIDSTYTKMLKCCFNARSNISNDILFIESGFLPIKAIILMRQFKFYKRFCKSIKNGSRREKMFNILLTEETNFIQHYKRLSSRYSCIEDIANEYKNEIK